MDTLGKYLTPNKARGQGSIKRNVKERESTTKRKKDLKGEHWNAEMTSTGSGGDVGSIPNTFSQKAENAKTLVTRTNHPTKKVSLKLKGAAIILVAKGGGN